MGDSENSLKNRTIRGIFWSGIDKLSFELIQFVIGIVMARLLLPEDYGVIGILLVFISFSNLFIDGGMTAALIQKNDRTDNDFCTAFIYNIVVSVLLYIVLYISSPFIAKIYHNEDIIWLLRVLSFNLVISAFSSVQNTRLQIELNFKKISIISVTSGVVSGCLGVIFAYKGYGVWALVYQQLSNCCIKTIMLNLLNKWKPQFKFDNESFRNLFSFGYKLILTNCLARVYDNMYPLIIGKIYPFKSLGFYTRGYQFANFPASILNNVFLSVSFPVMSSIKEDSNYLRNVFRKYIMMSSFVIFPAMFFFVVVAEPIVQILLSDNWMGAVPFLRILCLGLMFQGINSINLNLLFVMGRSDLALKLEIIKKGTAISILFFSVYGGIIGICIGQSLYFFIATFLNSKYTKKLIDVDYITQLKDFGNVWLLALLASVVTWLSMVCIDNNYLKIFVSIVVYVIAYMAGNYILRTKQFLLMVEIIKTKIK